MKQLIVLLTIFTSSFFLFNGDVNADITITEDIETYINEDFLTKRSYTIDFAEANSYEYVILKSGISIFYMFYLEDTELTLSSSLLVFSHFYYYKLNSDYTFSLVHEYTNGSSFGLSNTVILDMSEVIYSSNSFNVIYNDKTYVVDSTNPFVTYYDIYEDINGVIEVDPHEEEIKTIENFYTVVIDKLSYLADVIVSNYIYLSIIVIFILIFIFKLIFRRLL